MEDTDRSNVESQVEAIEDKTIESMEALGIKFEAPPIEETERKEFLEQLDPLQTDSAINAMKEIPFSLLNTVNVNKMDNGEYKKDIREYLETLESGLNKLVNKITNERSNNIARKFLQNASSKERELIEELMKEAQAEESPLNVAEDFFRELYGLPKKEVQPVPPTSGGIHQPLHDNRPPNPVPDGRMISHAYHLRHNLQVVIELPSDLTPSEARRLAAAIETFPFVTRL